MTLNTTITCQRCGHQAVEIMPTIVCVFFYECQGCKAVLKPEGDEEITNNNANNKNRVFGRHRLRGHHVSNSRYER